MRIICAWVIYLTILCGALNWTQSTSGWLLLGLGPVLWLDRQVFRLLPWPATMSLGKAVLLRLFFFVVFAGLIYRLGTALGELLVGDRAAERQAVTLPNALMVGLVATMGLFWLELALDSSIRLVECWRPRRPGRSLSVASLAVMSCVALALFAVSPLNVFHPLVVAPILHPGLHQPPLAYEEVRFHTADGLELAGWWVPADEARGTVIFCHGHQGNRQQGHAILPIFHELRLNVLTFDFRGHGASAPSAACFGVKEVKDLRAAEAYVAQRVPGKPVYAMGVSYGAAVTLLTLPEAQHIRAAWVESGYSRLSDVADHRFTQLPTAARRALISSYSVLTWLDCGFWPLDANPIDQVPRAQVPVCFCHGSEDQLIPLNQGQALYAAYAGPKEHYWVAGGTHGSVSVQGGAEYPRRLKAFFGERLRVDAAE